MSRTAFCKALLIGAAITFSTPAFAGPHGDMGGKSREEIQKMSPEEREKFHAERKAKWDALSKDEKLKMIEERRSQRRQEMDARWESMSDDEKIQHVEKRMERKHHEKERFGEKRREREGRE